MSSLLGRRARSQIAFTFAAFTFAGFALLASGVARADSSEGVVASFRALIDRPLVALDPQTHAMPDHDGLDETHLTFTSEPGQIVPAIVLQSKDDGGERRPVVIVLHGTGGFKEQNLALLTTLAQRGFIAIAIDGRYHGERCAAGHGTDDYYAAIAQAYRDGHAHPWLFDTVYDVGRLIDYLQTRADVDASRIGLMGFSKGGMETYLAAATDPRIRVAVPCISVQSFAWGLANDRWHRRIGTVQGGFDAAAKADAVASPDAAFAKHFYDRLIPGIDGPLDCPNLLPFICPRPLLTINGERDEINPLAGAQLAIDATANAYASAGQSDRFRAEIEPGAGHEVKPEYVAEAVDWFARWLKPAAPTTATTATTAP